MRLSKRFAILPDHNYTEVAEKENSISVSLLDPCPALPFSDQSNHNEVPIDNKLRSMLLQQLANDFVASQNMEELEQITAERGLAESRVWELTVKRVGNINERRSDEREMPTREGILF